MESVYTTTLTCPTGNKVITSPGCAVGTTTHYVASSGFWYMINGLVYYKAAVAAGTAPTATAVPTGTYGLFGYEIGADGTIDKVDAAGNATGYTTWADAKAALPTASANHVLFMYVIVKAKGTGVWTGATDDFVAGSDCTSVDFINIATEPGHDINCGFEPSVVEVYNRNRNCWLKWDNTLSGGYGWTNHLLSSGILSSPRCAIGSTPENCANVQFDFMINNVVYTRAAVAAGTAPSVVTLPQGKFGLFGYEIGVDGTIDKKDASNNATGYNTAALALAALPTASAAHVLFMYFIVQALPGTNWVGATDDLVAGSDCTSVAFYNVTPSNPLTAHGITTLNGSTQQGFRVGYYSELFYPSDTLYVKAWR